MAAENQRFSANPLIGQDQGAQVDFHLGLEALLGGVPEFGDQVWGILEAAGREIALEI